MRKSSIHGAVGALILAGVCAVPAQAATAVFSDNFQGYSASSILNWSPPAGSNWIVTSGTVDYIVTPNQWGIVCDGGSGACIDLDGSTNDAGLLSNGVFLLQANTRYDLAIRFSGNQRNSAAESLTFGLVDTSSNLLNSLTLAGIVGSTFDTAVVSYVVGATPVSARIFFQAAGSPGDNVGPILDNVTLTAVPLPAAAWLLLSGLVGFGALARRKTT